MTINHRDLVFSKISNTTLMGLISTFSVLLRMLPGSERDRCVVTMVTLMHQWQQLQHVSFLFFKSSFFALFEQFIHQNFGILSTYVTKLSSKLLNDFTENVYVNWNFSHLQQISS